MPSITPRGDSLQPSKDDTTRGDGISVLHVQRAATARVMYPISAAGVVASVCYLRCCECCALIHQHMAIARVLGESALAVAARHNNVWIFCLHRMSCFIRYLVIICDTSVRKKLEPIWFQNLVPKMTSDFQLLFAGDFGFGHVCIQSLWHKQARRQTNNRAQSRRQAVKHATKQPTHPHTRAEQHAAR